MQKKRILLGGLILLLTISAHEQHMHEATGEESPAEQPQDHTVRPAVVWTPSGEQAIEASPESWRAGEAMVRFEDIEDLYALARDLEAEISEISTRAGLAVLKTDQPVPELLRQLRADGRVQAARRHGLTVGAGKGGKSGKDKDKDKDDVEGIIPLDYASLQWHLDAISTPKTPNEIDDVLIAVLDTGVAYENYSDGSFSCGGGEYTWTTTTTVAASLGYSLLAKSSDIIITDGSGDSTKSISTYTQAPSLAGVSFLDPYDFVSDDSHANDDHQHGTHIASAIASDGAVVGVAPGASVMPLKVLGADNTGSELALIDALLWAADHGADVINLSLTFSTGYVPSPELLDALEYAWSSGAVLIAATGNTGDVVGFPASSPLVIGVGGACADGTPASYSNYGPATELIAPGGCIDQDLNADGYPDGILAESIGLNTPISLGYWWFTGTSQAAAVTSGAAAHLLARGVDPAEIRFILQASAWDEKMVASGHGAGNLDLEAAVDSLRKWDPVSDQRFAAAMLPWLADNDDGTVSPTAMITVLDGDQALVDGAAVIGSFIGSSQGDFFCTLRDGRCLVTGEPVALTVDVGQAWEVRIEGVVSDGFIHRPEPMIFASDALDSFVDWLAVEEADRDVLLAWSWTDGRDEELGSIAEAYSVVNTGTGIATSPFGIIVTPPAIDPDAKITSTYDGTGIATSPFGFIRIETSPTDPIVIAVSGTGISTSPFSGLQIHTLLEIPDCPECLLDGTPILLGSGVLATTADITGTALYGLMEQGGFMTATGYQGASWVAVSADSGGMTLESVE
ncbi:MAG: hypothetical protein ACI8S6_001707 [Myxococcota bacterium]|jgi:hypothetical protein